LDSPEYLINSYTYSYTLCDNGYVEIARVQGVKGSDMDAELTFEYE